jgi:hypothetical protein
MVTEIAPDADYVAVAFYGKRANGSAASTCLKLLIRWFTELGYPANKIGLGRVGHRSKMLSFDRVAKRIESGADDIVDFTLLSMKPGGKIPLTDSILEATVYTKAISPFAVISAHSAVLTLESDELCSISQQLIEHLAPEYGIGYRRPHRLGPAFYAMGIVEGLGLSDEEDEEALAISNWNSPGMDEHVYREGILRDVYPWNFLNESHLKHPVEGKPLAKWIGSNPARGKLIAFPRGLVLWQLEESQLTKVRRSLDAAGMIFDWRQHT